MKIKYISIFETSMLLGINNAYSLLEYLKSLLEDIEGKVYFFFDEIQNC